ncbi:MAG: site-specific integrase [Bacteroidetes bacterium]|jgi:integrase/recombinase XerD|nr:site-specific integrase [Bacteroidota bacterium]
MSSITKMFDFSRSNKEKKHPVIIRVIHARQVKQLMTSVWIQERDWDYNMQKVRKSHPNSTRLNEMIRKKYNEVEEIMAQLHIRKKSLKSKYAAKLFNKEISHSFFEYAKRYLSRIYSEDKFLSHVKAEGVINKIKKYLNDNDLSFFDIDVEFLRDYEHYLRSKLNNATNTIHANLKVIRRIIYAAIDEGMLAPENNPFIRYKLKEEKTNRLFLSEDEMERIYALDLEETGKMYHQRNLFLFACYVGGMRISDLLQLTWSNYDGSHITTIMQKTKDYVSVKIPKKGQEILDIYRFKFYDEDGYVFPFLDKKEDYSDKRLLYKRVSSITTSTNLNLKKIGKMAGITKNMHFHMSRNSFATMALKKGIRIEYVSKLMGHQSITTTQVYAKIVNADLDKAMEIFDE